MVAMAIVNLQGCHGSHGSHGNQIISENKICTSMANMKTLTTAVFYGDYGNRSNFMIAMITIETKASS